MLNSIHFVVQLHYINLPKAFFAALLRRPRTNIPSSVYILVAFLIPHLYIAGYFSAKRPRKFLKIETSYAKRFYKIFSEALFGFLDFSPRFQNHPPVTVNVRGRGRVTGLLRLGKSSRIVNHPPSQAEKAAPFQQTPPGALESRRKHQTVSLIDNKRNS